MTYEEYKKKKAEQQKADEEKLTAYQKYRQEKGLSLTPTFKEDEKTSAQQILKRTGAPVRDGATSRKVYEKRQETAAPKTPTRNDEAVRNAYMTRTNPTTLESALSYHRETADEVPILDLGPQVKKTDDRTWFQKGALEDGATFKNWAKGSVATTADAKADIRAGALGLAETSVDTAAWLAPGNLASQIQGNYGDPAQQAGANLGKMLASWIMGKDANYVQDQHNEMAAKAYAESKAGMEEFIKKDLIDEQAVAKWLVDHTTVEGIYTNTQGIDVEKNSFLGDKSDSLVQSGGQLAAQTALAAAGVPWWLTSGISAFGGETENALRQGATFEEAGVSGLISAGAEILTEKLSGGIKFGGKALDDVLTQDISKKISSRFIQALAKFGIQATGEGFEEIFSDGISKFGRWLTYQDDKTLQEMFATKEAFDEALEAFIGGAVLGGGGSVVQSVQEGRSGAQGGENTQGTQMPDSSVSLEATEQAAAETKPGSPEWVQEIVEQGRTANAPTQAQTGEQAMQAVIDEVLSNGTVADPVSAAVEKLVQQKAENNNVQPSNANEQSGVKEQIRSKQDELNTMQPAAEIQAPTEFEQMDKAGKQNWVVEKLRSTGYKVDRKGFGIIDFAKKRLKAAFKYFDSGSAEEAAFEALPYVLENGIEISSHSDHKGRTYRTVTIAAPVIINGKRGNMAVVVKQTDGNHYKVHRILTPDGSVFQLSETTNEADRADGGVTENGSLATSNGAASLETGVRGSTLDHGQTHSLIPASDVSISKTEPGVNSKVKNVGAEESVGAAPAGYSENTVGGAQSRFAHQQKTSKVYSNSYTNATDAEVRKVGEEAKTLNPNIDKYDVVTEKESLYNAKQRTRSDEEIAFEYDALVNKSGWSGEDNDTAVIVLRYLLKNGDVDKFKNLTLKQRAEETTGGQLIQSLAKYSRMSPERVVSDVVLSVDKLTENDVPKRFYKKQGFENWKNDVIKSSMEISDQIEKVPDGDLDGIKEIIRSLANYRKTTAWFGMSSKLTKLAESALKDIDFDTAKMIANAQLATMPNDFKKRTIGQVVKTIRIHNMLASLTTFATNMAGNATVGVFDALSDSTAGQAIDAMVASVTGIRSTGADILQPKAYFKGAADAAKIASLCTELDIPMDSESRFSTGSTRTFSPQGGPVERFLSAFDKYMRYSLEVSDQLFEGGANAAVSASLEKLGNKSGLTEMQEEEISKLAGKRRTYKDERALRKMSVGVKNALNEVGGNDFGLGDITLPFAGTGSNVIQVGIDYTSLGVGGLVDVFRLISDVKHGKYVNGYKTYKKNGRTEKVSLAEAQRAAVTNAGRGITGVGLVAMFAALAASGILKVHDDEDKDKRGLEQSLNLTGAQINADAALRGLENGETDWKDGDSAFSLDFLEPFNAQMRLGYLLAQEDSVQGMVKSYGKNAVVSIAQSILDLPMMESLANTIDSAQGVVDAISQGEDSSAAWANAAGQIAGNVASGFVPAIMRQTAQVIDPYYRDTTGANAGEKAVNQILAQIPFASQTLPKKYSGLGDEQRRYENLATGIFDTFLNPGDIDQIKQSDVADYLSELSSRTGDVTIYPAYIAPGSFTMDKEKVQINGKSDTEAYQKTYGDNVNRLYGQLIKNQDFLNASDDLQIKILNSAKDYAVMLAKAKVSDYNDIPSYIKNRASGMSEADAILRHAVLTKSNGAAAANNTEKYSYLNVDKASFVVKLMDDLIPETGKTNVRDIQKIEAVTKSDSKLSVKEQQQVIEDILDDAAYSKYKKISALGMDNDEYAESYRLYLDASGTGKKDRTIARYQKEFGISKAVAKRIYEIYAGTK